MNVLNNFLFNEHKSIIFDAEKLYEMLGVSPTKRIEMLQYLCGFDNLQEKYECTEKMYTKITDQFQAVNNRHLQLNRRYNLFKKAANREKEMEKHHVIQFSTRYILQTFLLQLYFVGIFPRAS